VVAAGLPVPAVSVTFWLTVTLVAVGAAPPVVAVVAPPPVPLVAVLLSPPPQAAASEATAGMLRPMATRRTKSRRLRLLARISRPSRSRSIPGSLMTCFLLEHLYTLVQAA